MREQGVQRSLRALNSRTPFRPFLIEFISGDQVLVRHPEAVALEKNVLVFRDAQGRHQLFDATTVCRLIEPANEESK
jgi:hypothetical protein